MHHLPALVDRVVPAVAVRQWLLSLPFELRGLAAFDAKVAILHRAIAHAFDVGARRARRLGVEVRDGS